MTPLTWSSFSLFFLHWITERVCVWVSEKERVCVCDSEWEREEEEERRMRVDSNYLPSFFFPSSLIYLPSLIQRYFSCCFSLQDVLSFFLFFSFLFSLFTGMFINFLFSFLCLNVPIIIRVSPLSLFLSSFLSIFLTRGRRLPLDTLLVILTCCTNFILRFSFIER